MTRAPVHHHTRAPCPSRPSLRTFPSLNEAGQFEEPGYKSIFLGDKKFLSDDRGCDSMTTPWDHLTYAQLFGEDEEEE